MSYSSGKVAFSASLYLPLSLQGGDLALSTDIDTNGNYKKIADSSELTFGLAPEIRLGLQYQIIPGSLTLSMGGYIGFSSIFETTTSIEGSYMGISLNSTEEKTVYGYDADISGSHDTDTGINLGFSLNFTQNLWLEVMTGVRNNAKNFNVFGTSGNSLTVFSNILIGLRF